MTPRERLARLDATLAVRTAAIRNNDRRRRIALAVAIIVGLGLSWIHWLGLIAGGAIVGLTRESLLRAITAGAGFGALTVGLTVIMTPTLGVSELRTLSRLTLVTVVVGVCLPAWGALIRGVL